MGAWIGRTVVVGSALLGALCTAASVAVVVAGLFRSHVPQAGGATALFERELAGPVLVSAAIITR